MKFGLALLFVFTILTLLTALWLTRKNRSRLARNLHMIFIGCIICSVGSMLSVFSKNIWFASYGFSFFFAGIDFLLSFFLVYTCNFVKKSPKKTLLYSIAVILILDIICIFLSPILNHFGYNFCFYLISKSVNGENFFFYGKGPLFNLHLILSYILVVMIFSLLIPKAVKTPPIYRWKYLSVIVVLSLVLMLDGEYLLSHLDNKIWLSKFLPDDQVFNFIVFGFGFGSVIIYIFTIHFATRQLLTYTLKNAVTEMPDGFAIFDNENRCIFLNRKWYSPVDKSEIPMSKIHVYFEKWCAANKLDYNKDFTFDLKVPSGGYFGKPEYAKRGFLILNKDGYHFPKYFRIQNNLLLDEKKNVLGRSVIIHDTTEEEKARHDSMYDTATGIYNYQYFQTVVQKELEDFPDEEFVFLYSDYTDFKLVNTLLGRDTGDSVIKVTAFFLRERQFLFHKRTFFCHVKDDKFAMVLRKSDYEEEIFTSYAKCLMELFSTDAIKMSLHIGYYEITDKTESIPSMLDKAKIALHQVKYDLSKLIGFYDPKSFEREIYEKSLIAVFEQALADGEFKVYLQPQCSEDGTVKGAEALIRWFRDGKMISPGDFISVLEKTGYIVQLDNFVWTEAAKLLASWKHTEFEDLTISVNVSSRDIEFSDVYSYFTSLVEKYGIEPGKLKIEITETILVCQITKVNDLVNNLRSYGFFIEIDDFGSGYSSLNMLKSIDVDVLKIDMGFLQGSDTPKSRLILAEIFNLAKKLDLSVITEGVETQEQLEMLSKMGGILFQGYLFSKPIPVSDFLKFAAKSYSALS